MDIQATLISAFPSTEWYDAVSREIEAQDIAISDPDGVSRPHSQHASGSCMVPRLPNQSVRPGRDVPPYLYARARDVCICIPVNRNMKKTIQMFLDIPRSFISKHLLI